MNARLPNKRRKPGLKTRRSFIALSFSAFIFLGATLGIYGTVANSNTFTTNTSNSSDSSDNIYSYTVDNSRNQTSSNNQRNVVQETRVSTKSSGS